VNKVTLMAEATPKQDQLTYEYFMVDCSPILSRGEEMYRVQIWDQIWDVHSAGVGGGSIGVVFLETEQSALPWRYSY